MNKKNNHCYHRAVLSLILPTYNEAENIGPLLERLSAVLPPDHEMIVVDDDSPDRTWEAAERLAQRLPSLRVIRRMSEKGLSSAVMAGFDAARGEILMVMDSDLQHDPVLIPRMVDLIAGKQADLVIASRYVPEGSVGNWVHGRRIMSTVATTLSRIASCKNVSDPMSGYFALHRDAYRAMRARLRPTGFKILLECLAFLPAGATIVELPLAFQPRLHGESKLNVRVQLQFLGQIIRIAFRRFFL